MVELLKIGSMEKEGLYKGMMYSMLASPFIFLLKVAGVMPESFIIDLYLLWALPALISASLIHYVGKQIVLDLRASILHQAKDDKYHELFGNATRIVEHHAIISGACVGLLAAVIIAAIWYR